MSVEHGAGSGTSSSIRPGTPTSPTCARYREFVVDRTTFTSLTIEELLAANALSAETTAALRDRYIPR
jgi:hypothetical protein